MSFSQYKIKSFFLIRKLAKQGHISLQYIDPAPGDFPVSHQKSIAAHGQFSALVAAIPSIPAFVYMVAPTVKNLYIQQLASPFAAKTSLIPSPLGEKAVGTKRVLL